ncbi:hypothetical protein HPP92_006377 [Vanilla planifolia]|uniref:Secreted protein n=1 Tax=Vanilla planifolia TaxID=51239 RepID=A0A835RK78_VANPL|nr:hypothetical protein HPP92_006377 [Vanilla planifolia]
MRRQFPLLFLLLVVMSPRWYAYGRRPFPLRPTPGVVNRLRGPFVEHRSVLRILLLLRPHHLPLLQLRHDPSAFIFSYLNAPLRCFERRDSGSYKGEMVTSEPSQWRTVNFIAGGFSS